MRRARRLIVAFNDDPRAPAVAETMRDETVWLDIAAPIKVDKGKYLS